MELLLDTLLALLCFGVLLASGAWVFGGYVGSPTRGAALPLLIVPLLSDWLRFLFKISFISAFGAAISGYLVVALVQWWLNRRSSRPKLQFDHHWLVAILLFSAIHVVMRCWLVTGSVPNPADDTFAGYKALALLNSEAWPTGHPEAPELTFSYYYYGYSWPAGFAALGISLKAGWWATAVVLCVVGGMLALELVLPRLQKRREVILAVLTLVAGCSWSFLLAIIQRLPLRSWMQEGGYLTTSFGLYMRVPQGMGGYWAPFNVFTAGTLLVATILIRESISERWSPWRFTFATLAVASLAGYCTFDLLGFALVVVPVLAVAAWKHGRPGALRRWFGCVMAVGVSSVIATLPLLLDLAQRKTGIRYGRFRDPLHIWIQTAFEKFSVVQVVGLGLWTLAAAALSSVLLFPLLRQMRTKPLDPQSALLLGVFGFGTVVCFFGVTDDFVPKFGVFVADALILAFLGSGPWGPWARWVWVSGLVVPLLMVLNQARANVASQKWDLVWREIDRTVAKSGEIVLYDVSVEDRRKRNPWHSVLPFFGRTRFLVPADQVDDQGQNFLRDPAELENLPPTEARLVRMIGDAPSYLLLTTPDRAANGDELYHSDLFSLRRIHRDPPAH